MTAVIWCRVEARGRAMICGRCAEAWPCRLVRLTMRGKTVSSYDIRCEDLARVLTQDEWTWMQEHDVQHLAQSIQDFVSMWVTEHRPVRAVDDAR